MIKKVNWVARSAMRDVSWWRANVVAHKILSFCGSLLLCVLVAFYFASCKSAPEEKNNFIEKTAAELRPLFEPVPCEYRKISTSGGADGATGGDSTDGSDSGKDVLPLSKEQIEEDTDEFIYLLETCYSGYERAKNAGLDLEKLSSNIKARFSKRTDIPQDEFAWALWKETFPYVRDMHFVIQSEKSWYQYCPHKNVFFSNTYVKKENGEYRIFLTDSNVLKIGQKYTGSERNLFYYPSRGLDVYRIGVVTDKNALQLEISVEGGASGSSIENASSIENGSVAASVSNSAPSGSSPTKETSASCGSSSETKLFLPVQNYDALKTPEGFSFKESVTESSAYVYISTFCTPEAESKERKKADKAFLSYQDAPKKFLGKKNIILDLRGNEGGNMNISLLFPIHLYLGIDSSFYKGKTYDSSDMADVFIKKYYDGCFTLDSPGTVQNSFEYVGEYFPEMKETLFFLAERNKILLGNPVRSIFSMCDYASAMKEVDFSIPEKSAFTGNLIIITDRNSFSASEDIVTFSRLLFKNQANVYIIGENSAGCIEFGGLLTYTLHNSSVLLNLSQSAFYPFEEKVSSWKGEGLGHYPDAWCTSDDVRETLSLLCN